VQVIALSPWRAASPAAKPAASVPSSQTVIGINKNQ
jgi:hypothetical protein